MKKKETVRESGEKMKGEEEEFLWQGVILWNVCDLYSDLVLFRALQLLLGFITDLGI